MMQVTINQIHSAAEIPKYATDGSVGFDLACCEYKQIAPGELALIRTGLVVDTPRGFMLNLIPRSSTFKKFGLIMPHSLGVIDQDYHGPEDELLIQVLNLASLPSNVYVGDKIAQGVFTKISKAKWDISQGFDSKILSRNGFGSTDKPEIK